MIIRRSSFKSNGVSINSIYFTFTLLSFWLSSHVLPESPQSTKQIRVLLLASEWTSEADEAFTFIREFAAQLDKHHDVQVFVGRPLCENQEDNITTVEVTEKASGKIFRLSEDIQIDFVIGLGEKHGKQANCIAQKLQCNWIQFVYSDPEYTRHQEELNLYSMANFVVAVGPELAEAYRCYMRFCGQKVYDFTPGIFRELSNKLQDKNHDDKFKTFVISGSHDKEFTMAVVQEVLTKLKDTLLILVGEHDNQHEEIESMFSGLPQGNPRSITSEKFRERFPSVDLVIMLSRNGNFGFIGLEAMSAGLPVLLCANSGLGKALTKVKFGSDWVVNSENAVEWAKKIENFGTKDRGLRLEESEDVRENYAGKYSWEKQCNDLVEMMKGILNGRNFQF